ncbi:catechol 2,3-dioxygenase-like lactoylglutathione lyase family enzyme [Xanthomonas arboricola]|uniref:Bleomycin resistance protein n=2 Tax=Xanthomonas cannabis TaxID=1885674 RepID=A0ABR6JNK3_9XANT|nr:catechol 2,3-dioxygenase-like lactoylglutathione lyase family enzyme [Xanthomonas cannabis]MBB5522929.1 catechol 2,3-dioxygenase-like lactoylglutathione lyase family enzyme [Xanthomonas cannabis]
MSKEYRSGVCPDPATDESMMNAQANAADQTIPILPSRAIAQTLAFYRRLGFEGDAHPHDAGYAILRRGAVELHFFAHPDLDPAACYAGCYLRVGNVDDVYAALQAAGLPAQGIPRIDPLADKPWGMREFAIVDESGNLLRIGQVIAR